ncbi:MAG: hypothetical protein Q8L10_01665 [Candidatus Moranbacteria bacterium]|nr:hypothetical protein [Candidatus Moranbacteria bacterium]
MEEFKIIEEGEVATDMEVAMNLIKHIDNPYVDGQGNSAREVYVEEARNVLDTLTNPEAKKMLEDAIKEHSPESPENAGE